MLLLSEELTAVSPLILQMITVNLVASAKGKALKKPKLILAVGEMQEVYAEEGSKFPDVEFDFIYDMASFLNYYAYAFSLAGLARITGVNQGQLSHYVTGRRRPSKSTVEKIEQSLHDFANEIGQVKFA